jgi:hypothetical protein
MEVSKMSDPTLPGTPGTGDLPEPEDPSLREEIIDATEQERLAREADRSTRSTEAKEFYAGGAAEDAPEPATRSASASNNPNSPPPSPPRQ